MQTYGSNEEARTGSPVKPAAGLVTPQPEGRGDAAKSCSQPNTKIEFLYRDADNYKVWTTAIVSDAITDAQIDTIISCLSEGEWFIPDQVGLEGERFSEFDPEVDHLWFELYRSSFSHTSERANTTMDVTALVAAFEAAYEQNWNGSKLKNS